MGDRSQTSVAFVRVDRDVRVERNGEVVVRARAVDGLVRAAHGLDDDPLVLGSGTAVTIGIPTQGRATDCGNFSPQSRRIHNDGGRTTKAMIKARRKTTVLPSTTA